MASLAPESNGAHTHTGPAAVHPEASNGSISTSSNGGAAVAPSEAAGGAATAAAQTASVVLEREMPLPDSMLWKLQQAFYEEVNVRAWSEAIVPNFVTSNAFIAAAYAKIILCFLRDHFLRSASADPTQPVYLIEVGTGHGKLTYMLLRALVDMREYWPVHVKQPFVYVMTDFTQRVQKNLDFWHTHPCLAPYIKDGLLDTALFDGEASTTITLTHSRVTLAPGTVTNPVLAICNYVFDTLKQDAFRVINGQLEQALCTVLSSRKESNPLHPAVLRRVSFEWTYRPVSPDLYTNKHLQAVLSAYQQAPRNQSVLIPVGGMGMIDRIAALAGGRCVIVAGDKAYNHAVEMRGLRDPHIAVHGSFSMMVNFHAVNAYIASLGGFSMHTPFCDGFKCSAFVLGGTPEQYPELRQAWHNKMMTFGPEAFSTLQRAVKAEDKDASLKTAVSILRLSRYDPDIFYKFRQVYVAKAAHATEKQKKDLLVDIGNMYDNYFPLQKNKDVAFEIGRLYMTLKRYDEAIDYFSDSHAFCDEHHVSWYNMGICNFHSSTPDLVTALECFERSLALSPSYTDAKHWMNRVRIAMDAERDASAAAEAAEAAATATAATAATASTTETPGTQDDNSTGDGAVAGGGPTTPQTQVRQSAGGGVMGSAIRADGTMASLADVTPEVTTPITTSASAGGGDDEAPGSAHALAESPGDAQA